MYIFIRILGEFYEKFEDTQPAAGPPATPWLRTPPPTRDFMRNLTWIYRAPANSAEILLEILSGFFSNFIRIFEAFLKDF